MSWIQIGMAKSGNSLAYNVTRRIQAHADLWNGSFIATHPVQAEAATWPLSLREQSEIDVIDIEEEGCSYRISSAFRQPIDDLEDYVSRTSLVWTHSAYCHRTPAVVARFGKATYVCRDPRDVAISRAHFMLTPYMKRYYPNPYRSAREWLAINFEHAVTEWVRHVVPYLLHTERLGLRWVFFERMVADLPGEVDRLAADLDVQLAPDQVADIVGQSSRGSMKSRNSDHVRSGRRNQWMDVLSEKQVARAVELAGPVLSALGYPADRGSEGLPSLPADVDPKPLREALASAQPSIAARVTQRTASAWLRARELLSGGATSARASSA